MVKVECHTSQLFLVKDLDNMVSLLRLIMCVHYFSISSRNQNSSTQLHYYSFCTIFGLKSVIYFVLLEIQSVVSWW